MLIVTALVLRLRFHTWLAYNYTLASYSPAVCKASPVSLALHACCVWYRRSQLPQLPHPCSSCGQEVGGSEPTEVAVGCLLLSTAMDAQIKWEWEDPAMLYYNCSWAPSMATAATCDTLPAVCAHGNAVGFTRLCHFSGFSMRKMYVQEYFDHV